MRFCNRTSWVPVVLQGKSSHGRYFVLFAVRNHFSRPCAALLSSHLLRPSLFDHYTSSLSNTNFVELLSFQSHPRLFSLLFFNYSLFARGVTKSNRIRATKTEIDAGTTGRESTKAEKPAFCPGRGVRARASCKSAQASFCFESILWILSKIHCQLLSFADIIHSV